MPLCSKNLIFLNLNTKGISMRIYLYLLLLLCGLSLTTAADNCYEVCSENQREIFKWCPTPNKPLYTKGELLLKLHSKTTLPQLEEKIPYKKYGIQSLQPIFKNLPSLQSVYRLQFTHLQFTDELRQTLEETQLLEYVEKSPAYHTFHTPNDLHPSQWSISKTDAQTAWDYVQGSESVVVAIVDDAVELTHEDLTANIWQNTNEIAGNGVDDDENGYVDDVQGYDVADQDNNPNPPSNADAHHFSHGTHCAGIVSAATDNNRGIAAIGGNVQLMAVKTKENATSGSSLQAGLEGIEYAIAAEADVISLSWGGAAYSQTMQDLLEIAHQQGITLIAAAGNSDTNAPMYPASYDHVISVGATNQEDEKAFFSNYGSKIDVMAPGFEIWSTVAGNSYDFKNGTSMACPLVAGLTGLMLSYDANLSPDDIEDCLKSTCENIDAQNSAYIGEIGGGRINAFEALSCLRVPPTAHFEANLEAACVGEAVQFFDKSLGADIDTWAWNFENGTPSFSNLQNPIVSFTSNGIHEVTLTVSNSLGNHALTKNFTTQPPTATVSGNSTITEGSNTAFKVTFTGSPPFSITYTDGQTQETISGILENPYYVVFSPSKSATYTLISMDSAGCEGETGGQAKVSVLPPPQYEAATGSGLPVWPFVSSAENTCETWTWFPEENWEYNSCPFNGPFSASGVGLTPCGEPLFYVYHTGEIDSNQLFVADVNGQPLHTEGMNALEINKELQVVPVPEVFNEWYVVYSIFTDEVLAGSHTQFTPTNIVYSRFFYDGTSFSFIEKDVILEAGNQVRTYTHGKAVSQRMGNNEDFHYLYACRRSWNSNALSFDRFILDSENIRWDKSTSSTQEAFWNLTIWGSPMEISPKGDKMVVVVRNQSYTANDLLIVDLEQFNLSSIRRIQLGRLILMPDFENLFEPMRVEEVAENVEGLGFLQNMQRKVFDAEFSSSGDFLYFSNGGYVSSNYTNLTYLGQIDLTTPYPYQVRLQVQTTPDDSYDVDTGRGCVYTSACLSKYNPINNIELGYDGRLYFQKRTTSQLYAVPDANLPMPQRLIPGNVDLSTPESPNIPVNGALSAFPQSIDGYQYIPPNFAKFNIPIQIEDCNACLETENFPVTVELQTAEGELIQTATIDECPDAIEVCLEISRQYRLFYNGMYIEDILEEGKLWEELPYIFRQNMDVELILEEVLPICLGTPPIALQASPTGGDFSGEGVENGFFDSVLAGLGTHTIYYEYTDAATECVALESIKIEVVGVEIDAGIPPTICPNESVELQASNASNYLWSPSNDLSATDISNPIATPSQTTTYRVETTDENGCTAWDEVTVYVAPLPVLEPLEVDTSACGTTVLEVDMSDKIIPISDYSYRWIPMNGVSNPNIAQPIISLSESRTYTLEVENVMGCVASQEVAFNVELGETALELGDNQQINCGENLTLKAPQNGIYHWSPPIGLSCTDCSNPTANPTETTTYHLFFEDSDGCVSEDSITVEIVPLTLDLGENQKITCGDNILLNAPENGIYHWSPSMGLSCTDCSSPIATPTETTTYHLTFETSNGCVAEDSITIEVTTATLDLGENLQMDCGDFVVLAAPEGNAYSWSPPMGLSCTDCRNPIATPSETSTYHLILEDLNECILEDSVRIEVVDELEVANVPFAFCEVESVVLNGGDFAGYEWSNDSTEPNIVVENAGVYSVTLTDDGGCRQVHVFEIVEHEKPEVSIEGQAEILEGESAVLATTPDDFVAYEWSNNSMNETIGVSIEGNYLVAVTDENGCTAIASFYLNVLPIDTLPVDTLPVDTLPIDTIETPIDTTTTDTIPDLPTDTIPNPPIEVDLENKLVVPTAFSPNGDGVNDVFWIQGQNVVDIRYAIFNRWGQKVFEADNLVAMWDGRFKGQDLDLGAYVVEVWVRFGDGKEEVRRGWVLLIR